MEFEAFVKCQGQPSPKKNRNLNYYFAIIFVLFSSVLHGQDQMDGEPAWNFVNERPGIKVYTRTPINSSIKELRILVDLEGDIDTLMKVVYDASNFGTWVYKCADSEIVPAPEGYSSAYAATSDFPFPMSDRELVAVSHQWYDDEGRLHARSISAPDAIPLKPGIVRIKSYEANWVIEKIAENKIHIDYTSSVDPGGQIPTWVINLAITAGPIKTFEKLIKQVKKRSLQAETSVNSQF